jgi:hypothetical protein
VDLGNGGQGHSHPPRHCHYFGVGS